MKRTQPSEAGTEWNRNDVGHPRVSQQDPTTRVIAGTTADVVFFFDKVSSLPSPEKSEVPEPAVHHAQYSAEIHIRDCCPVKCKGRSHLARGQGLRAWALGSGVRQARCGSLSCYLAAL